MQNWQTQTQFFNYLMQPGDGTLYRFGFATFPDTKRKCPWGDSYILEGGVAHNPKGYIFAYINMPSGTGIGTIMLENLEYFPEHTYYIHDLQSHDFRHVDTYTLIAILLALKILISNPEDIVAASDAMLAAAGIVSEFVKER